MGFCGIASCQGVASLLLDAIGAPRLKAPVLTSYNARIFVREIVSNLNRRLTCTVLSARGEVMPEFQSARVFCISSGRAIAEKQRADRAVERALRAGADMNERAHCWLLTNVIDLKSSDPAVRTHPSEG